MARDRQQTEQALVEAVGEVLANEGFQGIGVNAVAGAAGVDKVLIYRYFDGLPNLLRAYGESGDFWPSVDEVLEAAGADLMTLPPRERVAAIVTGLLDALLARPQTLEILAWEAVQQNALTETLAEIRERWAQAIIARALSDAGSGRADLTALGSLLVAGIQYLMIRSRHSRHYGGIDLHSAAGWQRIRSAVAEACGSSGSDGET